MDAATDDARLQKPLTLKLAAALFARLAQPLADNLVSQVENMGRQLHGRLVALEEERDGLRARVAELEAAQLQYRGIWSSEEFYRPGDFSTYGGTIWYCHEATTDKPGTTECWQLMVKGGGR